MRSLCRGRFLMRVVIIGGDGYCGWATSLHLSKRGHDVSIIDNFARRYWDLQFGAESLTPLGTMNERLSAWTELTGHRIKFYLCNVSDYPRLTECLTEFSPEAIVHFGEQRSAPFSMIDRDHAVETQ